MENVPIKQYKHTFYILILLICLKLYMFIQSSGWKLRLNMNLHDQHFHKQKVFYVIYGQFRYKITIYSVVWFIHVKKNSKCYVCD